MKSWSTRQLAEMAGTTVRAIRHYHAVGLLAEPERASNGYKLYGTDSLQRLVEIRRLAGLGLPLSRISTLYEGEVPADSLDALDRELVASAARLELLRSELATLRRNAPPRGGGNGSINEISSKMRSLILVCSRILSPAALNSVHTMVEQYPTGPPDRQFDDLLPDADEETRARLADELAPKVLGFLAANPWLPKVMDDAPLGRDYAQEILQATFEDLYNAAQVDVLRRILRRRKSAEAEDHRPPA